MPDSSPHSDRRAEAWSRIDTTKTEDMVPSSELRGWLAEYVGLFEQFEVLRDAAQAVADAKSYVSIDGRTVLAEEALAERVDALRAVLYPASTPDVPKDGTDA